MNTRQKIGFYLLASVAGMPLVLASVPKWKEISNDTAIYQRLHEVKMNKIKNVDFDGDIQRLSAREKSHRQGVPLRLQTPMERIDKVNYRYSGASRTGQKVSGIKKTSIQKRAKHAMSSKKHGVSKRHRRHR